MNREKISQFDYGKKIHYYIFGTGVDTFSSNIQGELPQTIDIDYEEVKEDKPKQLPEVNEI